MASFILRSGKSYELPKGYVGVTEGNVITGDLNWSPSKNIFTLPHPNDYGQNIGNFYAVVRKIKKEYKATLTTDNKISVFGVITEIPKEYMLMLGENIVIKEKDIFFTKDTHKWAPVGLMFIGDTETYTCLARPYKEETKTEDKKQPKSRLARIAIKK